MRTEIVIPKTGMGIDEGTIVAWLKSEGDAVVQGETIVEIETAKATIEVEAPATGILTHIFQPEGATVEVNVAIGEIEPR